MNAAVSFPNAIRLALADALAADASVMVLTEGDTPENGALAQAAPGRVLALPVSDRATAAVAVGLAWGGRRVLVEVAASGRLPALAEVLAEAARVPEGFRANVVLRVPCGGEAGRVDGTVLDLLAGIDGLRVVCPRDPAAASGLLRGALRSNGPVVVLEPRALLRSAGPVSDEPRALDGCEVVQAGDHVTVATWGAGVDEALHAAEALADERVGVEVIDLVSLVPLDAAGLGERVRRTGRLVVAAPAPDAAFAPRVIASVLGPAFLYLESPPAACEARAGDIATAARAVASY